MRRPALLALLALLASCAAVRPPERPVAYIYPTTRPMAALSEMTPVNASLEDIRALLDKLGVLRELVDAGLTDVELGIVCRGLAKHGYSEIDARRSRTKSRIRTVAVWHLPDGLHARIYTGR